jgi:hypothetical protein
MSDLDLDQDWKGGSYVRTFSGRQVDPLNLRPEDVHIVDIAHSLSLQCRYMGHSAGFYSVAEHSVYVANTLRRAGHDVGLQLEGLMHDSSEAYLMDVPRPIKASHVFTEYRALEAKIEQTVAERFGLPYPMSAVVKAADMEVYRAEQATIRDFGGRWTPAEAEARFTDLYRVLYRTHFVDTNLRAAGITRDQLTVVL